MSDVPIAAPGPDLRREPSPRSAPAPDVVGESLAVRLGLIALALVYLGLFLVLPLAVVFSEAFAKGWGPWGASFLEEDSQSAILLTLTVTFIAVPANVVFGIAAAWAMTKFDFPLKSLLLTLIDLPFSVSPVVAGETSARHQRPTRRSRSPAPRACGRHRG